MAKLKKLVLPKMSPKAKDILATAAILAGSVGYAAGTVAIAGMGEQYLQAQEAAVVAENTVNNTVER